MTDESRSAKESALGRDTQSASRPDVEPPAHRTELAERWLSEGVALLDADRYNEAVICLNRLIDRFGDAEEDSLRRDASIALAKKGVALVQLDRFEEAGAAFDAWCLRAQQESDPGVVLEKRLLAVARTLRSKMRSSAKEERHQEVIAAADAFLQRFSTEPPAGRFDLVVAALRFKASAMASLGNLGAAIQTIERLVDRYGELTDLPVQQSVARALETKAKLLKDDNRCDEAIDSYDELLTRFGSSTAPELREWVAIALHNKLSLLQAAGRYEDALTAVEEVIARFGCDPLPKRPYMALDALFRKSFFMHELGRRKDAIEVYGEFVERYRDDSDPHVRAKLAIVMSANTEQLLHAGRYEETVKAADELLASFGEAEDPELRSHVADGLRHKADALGKLGRWEAALAVDEQVIESSDDATTGGAWPLSHKAVALSELGQLEQAIAAWQEVIDRYSDKDTPPVSELVAKARTETATLKQLLNATSGPPGTRIRPGYDIDPKQLANRLGARGAALFDQENHTQAIKMFDTIIDWFQDTRDQELRGLVALAFTNKAVALSRLGREEESMRIHEEMVSRFGEDALVAFDQHMGHYEKSDDLKTRAQLISTLYSKASVLSSLKREAEALDVLRELITRFEDDDDPRIQITVSGARTALNEITDNRQP